MSAIVAMNEEARRIEQYMDVEANIKPLTTIRKGKNPRNRLADLQNIGYLWNP